MTDTTQNTTTQTPSAGPIIAIALVGVILAAVFFLGGSEKPIERSVTGLNGFMGWLRANEIKTLTFKGGAPIQGSKFDLRILPIYDTDLTADREVPEEREALIAQTSEFDLNRWVVINKINDIPTVVVLPKWRTGVRALGVAHKDLLIPRQEINRLLGQLYIEDARVTRDAEGFTISAAKGEDQRAQIGLVHAQTVEAPGCTALVTVRRQPLLLECGADNDQVDQDGKAGVDATVSPSESGDSTNRRQPNRFWVLTDPDVISNHGLSLAENAQAALTALQNFGVEQTIMLDLSDKVWIVSDDYFAPPHERTWDDLKRVFAWPFTMIWLGFALVAGLVLWRAVTRYGPLARVASEEPQAAKTTSIDAKARLLRLANHDAALLKTHIAARLQQLVAELLGPHRPSGKEPLAVLLPVIRRSNPELADQLSTAATQPGASTDMLGHLDRFENCYDRIRHEFGRATEPG